MQVQGVVQQVSSCLATLLRRPLRPGQENEEVGGVMEKGTWMVMLLTMTMAMPWPCDPLVAVQWHGIHHHSQQNQSCWASCAAEVRLQVLCKRELLCQYWGFNTCHLSPRFWEPWNVIEFCSFNLNYIYHFKGLYSFKIQVGNSRTHLRQLSWEYPFTSYLYAPAQAQLLTICCTTVLHIKTTRVCTIFI